MKKYFVLPESMRTKTIQSIRWIFIEVAGKVVKHAREAVSEDICRGR